MFDFFNLEINKVFKTAEEEMFSLKHPYVGTEHLLLALLKKSSYAKNLLAKYNLTYANFRKELLTVVGSSSKKSEYILYTPLLKRVIRCAISLASEENIELSDRHLLMAIFEEGEGIAIRILLGMKVDIDAIFNEFMSASSDKDALELLKIGRNLNELVSMSEKTIGRDKEIDYIIETLIRKNKNNPLLIGPAGVGKTAIIEELARRINNKEVPDVLLDKKIIMLEMGALVSGTKYRGEFEERLTKIIKELENHPEYIIFIDEIHSMVNAGGAEGAINASDIFKPYLARGTIKCIGATTTAEYDKFIAKDKALSRRFETINILEPKLDETKYILKQIKNNYEKHFNIKISDKTINELVDLTDQYLLTQKNPDKSLDILDSVCALISLKKYQNSQMSNLKKAKEAISLRKNEMIENNNYENAIAIFKEENQIDKKIKEITSKNKITITKDDILAVIFQKCNIPNTSQKRAMINNLNKNISYKSIINTLKNKFIEQNKPITFIFNSNNLTNKKALINNISTSLNIPLFKIDMVEYSNEFSINKLIGSTAGYIGYDDEPILNKFKNTPYSLIQIENYDQSSSNIKNLIKKIIEDGVISNAKGEPINFKNTIIIISTNVNKTNSIGFTDNIKNAYEEFFDQKLLKNIDAIIEITNENNIIKS